MNAYSEGGLSKVTNIADLPSASLATSIVGSNGIGDFNSIELSKVLTGKIASVSPQISTYGESMSGSSSVQDFETMLQLTYLHFTQPRKDEDSYAALLNMLKTSLANAEKNPNKAFSDSANLTISNHDPRVFLQDLSMVDKINQDKAIEIYKQRFANPADFTFVFVGNIDPMDKNTQNLLASYLGGLKTSKGKETYDKVYKESPKGIVKNYFKREMQTKKASNLILYSGAMPYTIGNSLNVSTIGSILNIRYMESIREKEGGSYGVGVRGSAVRIPVEKAIITMQFDTDPEKQAKLMDIIHQEVNEIIKNGPKSEDLQKVKENLLKQHAQNIETNGWWMSAVSSFYQYGINNLRDYKTAVEGLTEKSIQKTLADIVNQGNTIEVVMMPE